MGRRGGRGGGRQGVGGVHQGEREEAEDDGGTVRR